MVDLVLLGTESDIEKLSRMWAEAFRLWLASYESESTRRSYQDAWKDLYRFLGDVQPWRIGRSDVARWGAHLRDRKLSDCTKNQKMAGISSFYNYTMTEYTFVDNDGREKPLHGYNPAAGKSLRSHIHPYGKAAALTPQEVQRLLAAIPRNTRQGRRDYALFLTYLLTGRRNSEVRLLTWGSFEQDGPRVWYRWSGKRKKDQRHELPLFAWNAILSYLRATDRLEMIQPGDPIFTGFDQATGSCMLTALTRREVSKLVKRYARVAGLDAEEIHVHTLRHTAASLRRQAGDDLETVSHMLSHSSLAITQIYLDSMEGQEDKSWKKVGELLNLA